MENTPLPRSISSDELAIFVEHIWCAAWGTLGADSQILVEDTPAFLRIMSHNSSDLLLNAVLRYTHEGYTTRNDIEDVIAPYRHAHRPFQWWIRLGNEPPRLRNQLQQIGLMVWNEFQGMVLPLDSWNPPWVTLPKITTHAAQDRVDAETALNIICTAYNIPQDPMSHWCGNNQAFIPYIVYYQNTPIGAMTSLVHGDIVGFFHVVILPRWRRLGAASAMMITALEDARKQGVRVAALTSSEMAESLYHRLGFIDAGRFEYWMPGSQYMQSM
jgi:GNAT superfamily N-acetyltransferase